ncbi:MAG: hypothetical protein K0B16_03120 [Burkholderiaceae bacterium]|nr:hypothetical protein [Burkholderiaceae bacterium]
MTFFGEHRVMACSRAEMLRWLGELAPGRVAVVPQGFKINTDAVPLEIEVTELEARRFGLVKLDALDVRFHYPENAREAAYAWIERFDRHTLRGGG